MEAARGTVIAVACIAVAVGIAGVAAADHDGWHPPPPDFADTTNTSDLFAPIDGWEPYHGAPRGVLDRLPPGDPAVADVTGNGYPDVFVPNPGYGDEDRQAERDTSSRLFLNDWSSKTGERFVDVTEQAGIDTDERAFAAAWGDVGGDGAPDLLVAGHGFATLYEHDGAATFTDVTQRVNLPQAGLVTDAAWGDVDGDGDLDLALARYTPADRARAGGLDEVPGAANALLVNEDGRFREAGDAYGLDAARRSTSLELVDVNDDGRPDLFVTNHGEPDALWLNQGDRVEEAAAAAGLADEGRSTCQAWGDLDRDGRLDLVVGNADARPASVHLREGPAAFDNRTAGLDLGAGGAPTWGCDAADPDNDGDLDLVLARSNTTADRPATPRVLYNTLHRDGQLGFEDVTEEAGQVDGDSMPREADGTITEPVRAAGGLALVDVTMSDQAAADVLTTNHARDRAHLYRNVGWAGGWAGGNGEWLRVALDGSEANPLAIGARVTVEAGDLSITKARGLGPSLPATMTFGLAKPGEANYTRGNEVTVTVEWPDGAVDRYEDAFSVGSATRLEKGGGHTNDTMAPRVLRSLDLGERGRPGWFTSDPVRLTVTADEERRTGTRETGVASLAYSLGGDTWISVDPDEGAKLPFAGEGDHAFYTRATDQAGNTAVTLHPVRIDTQAPDGALVDPEPGGVYAQGTQVTRLPGAIGRALVLAPQPVDAPGHGLDQPGHQPVRVDAPPDTRQVRYEIAPVGGGTATADDAADRGPSFLWPWKAGDLPADEYRLEATLEDRAGHETTLSTRVTLVPTTAEGAWRTLPDDAKGLDAPDDPLIPDALPTLAPTLEDTSHA